MPPLQRSPIGDLVPITGFDPRFNESYAVPAFMPHPLPSRIDLPGDVWMLVSEAMTELGRLDASAELIANPGLLTRIATRREALGTSALEGTYANMTELLAAEILPLDAQEADVPPNVREVMNYTRAAEAAYEWVKERPVTIGLLSSLQAEIVRGTESDGPGAGAVRTSQVLIGAKHRRVSEARFVPPPPGDQLRAGFEQWNGWLENPEVRSHIQLLPRVALAHYQFEALHPYTDGNGRLGRLVAILQMLREGALRSPVLSVSTWLRDNADDYRNHLLEVSETGAWAPWVAFFARAVCSEARSGLDRIMRLLALRETLGGTVRHALPRARLAVEIADDLIAYPVLTVAMAHRRYGRTNQANRNAINALVDLGLLEPLGDDRYDRLYWNRAVFGVIDS